MKLAKDIWADMLEKRLWFPAALLIGAIAIFPMMLAKPGDPPVAPAAPAAKVDEESGPELALTRATNTGFSEAPHVNDKRLDPFGDRSPAAADQIVKKFSDALNTVTSNNSGGTSPSTGTPDPGSGGGTPSPSPTPDPTPATTPVKTESDDLLSVLVQTQGEEEPKELDDIRTLSPLVDPENPFLVYIGKASGNSASFLVSSDVTVSPTADGKCAPSPTDCRTLTLAVGETAEFTLLLNNNIKVSVTVIDLETKKVPIDDGTTETATAARLEHKARVVGAKTLKRALRDPEVVDSLVKNKIEIRT